MSMATPTSPPPARQRGSTSPDSVRYPCDGISIGKVKLRPRNFSQELRRRSGDLARNRLRRKDSSSAISTSNNSNSTTKDNSIRRLDFEIRIVVHRIRPLVDSCTSFLMLAWKLKRKKSTAGSTTRVLVRGGCASWNEGNEMCLDYSVKKAVGEDEVRGGKELVLKLQEAIRKDTIKTIAVCKIDLSQYIALDKDTKHVSAEWKMVPKRQSDAINPDETELQLLVSISATQIKDEMSVVLSSEITCAPGEAEKGNSPTLSEDLPTTPDASPKQSPTQSQPLSGLSEASFLVLPTRSKKKRPPIPELARAQSSCNVEVKSRAIPDMKRLASSNDISSVSGLGLQYRNGGKSDEFRLPARPGAQPFPEGRRFSSPDVAIALPKREKTKPKSKLGRTDETATKPNDREETDKCVENKEAEPRDEVPKMTIETPPVDVVQVVFRRSSESIPTRKKSASMIVDPRWSKSGSVERNGNSTDNGETNGMAGSRSAGGDKEELGNAKALLSPRRIKPIRKTKPKEINAIDEEDNKLKDALELVKQHELALAQLQKEMEKKKQEEEEQFLINSVIKSHEPMYSDGGVPLTGYIVHKALAHWGALSQKNDKLLVSVLDALEHQLTKYKRKENMELLSYWLSNCLLVLYLFRKETRHFGHDLPRNLEEFRSRLMEMIQGFYSALVESLVKRDSAIARCSRGHSMSELGDRLESYLRLFRDNLFDSVETQFFRQVFHEFGVELFNSILSRPELCCCGNAIQIKMAATELEDWIDRHNLSACREQLSPVRQAADALVMPKVALTDARVRSEVCPALSLVQLKKLILNYFPDDFDPEPVDSASIVSSFPAVDVTESPLLTATSAHLLLNLRLRSDKDEHSLFGAGSGIVDLPDSIMERPGFSFLVEEEEDEEHSLELDKAW